MVFSCTVCMTVKEISEVFKILKGTIYSIIKIYVTSARISSLPKGGDKRSILSDDDKQKIRRFVDEDPCITLKNLVIKVKNELYKNISESTAQRTLLNLHYSFKRFVLIPERRNLPENIVARREYATSFLNLISENTEDQIYFLDEVGFCVSMRQRYGRASVETSPYVVV